MTNSYRDAPENKSGPIDGTLIAIVFLLVSCGIIMVFSASGAMASDRSLENIVHYTWRQSLFAVAGSALAITVAYLPRRLIDSLHYPLLIAVFILLLCTLCFGSAANGARRWINVGLFTVQPLELAKPALALYLAYFLSSKQEYLTSFFNGVLPPFLITGTFCALLLLQPDYGGAFTLCAVFLAMFLVGGIRIVHLLAVLALILPSAYLLLTSSEYRMRRILAFLDPFKDMQGTGYQLVQSLYAFGSGGLYGSGLGNGSQKLRYLPEAHTDFILAVLGEECGFIGVSVIMFLFSVLFYRCYRIILKQTSLRDKLASLGISLVLCFGVLQNIGVVLGMLPPKGVAMPFLSYGGSSMIASLLCVGLLLNYSRTARS